MKQRLTKYRWCLFFAGRCSLVSPVESHVPEIQTHIHVQLPHPSGKSIPAIRDTQCTNAGYRAGGDQDEDKNCCKMGRTL